MSFYWALGGRLSVGTQAVSIRDQIDDPDFIAVLWGTGILKVLAGLIALALVRRWDGRIPRRMLLVAGWITAGFLCRPVPGRRGGSWRFGIRSGYSEAGSSFWQSASSSDGSCRMQRRSAAFPAGRPHSRTPIRRNGMC